MIKEFERYHGAALSRLVHGSDRVLSIRRYSSASNASYVVNEKMGLYVKHSTKRLSPWTFTFQRPHRAEILDMHRLFPHVFIVFVCHTDGIVCLRFAELQLILDCERRDVQWVRVSRSPRHKYAVAGKYGRLKSKIGDNEFPRQLLM
jgi:hypothetical protein